MGLWSAVPVREGRLPLLAWLPNSIRLHDVLKSFIFDAIGGQAVRCMRNVMTSSGQSVRIW